MVKKPKNTSYYVKAVLIIVGVFLFVAPALFLITYIFLFRPFQMNGESMNPSFASGEYILTQVRPQKLSRFDVVVYASPIDENKDFMKRVIGLPGETVSIKEGSVLVNGEKLDETAYLPSGTYTVGDIAAGEGTEVRIPEDSYFVLGDNRAKSADSRVYGSIPLDSIISKVLFCYWNCQ